jgi:hypothetical protein
MTLQFVPLIAMLSTRQEDFRVWGRFDHGKSNGTEELIVLAGITALLLLIAMASRIYLHRSQRTFASDNSARLFRELASAHGLNRAARRLLHRLALARGVANPALLFVEPQHFESQGLPAEMQDSAAELRQLRAKLFN